MGKSARAYGSREIKGQRREVLEAAEAQFVDEAEAKRRAALEKAAAAPPVPVVNRGPVRQVGRAAMDVDSDRQHEAMDLAQHPPGADDDLSPAEARLRRVMGSVTGYAIKKPRQQLKKMALASVHGPGKRKLQALKKAMKRGGAAR